VLGTWPWYILDRVVVALLAGEKAAIGTAFYNSVGHRADMLIGQWLRDRKGKSHD